MGMNPMAMMMQQRMMMLKGKGMMGGCGGCGGKGSKSDGGGGGKGSWKCDACGFTNKNTNQVCGGEGGTLGCKAPKPSDWVCECGFINKHSNDQCGGTGPMGCNLPRPADQ